jgi:hypothetical protein
LPSPRADVPPFVARRCWYSAGQVAGRADRRADWRARCLPATRAAEWICDGVLPAPMVRGGKNRRMLGVPWLRGCAMVSSASRRWCIKVRWDVPSCRHPWWPASQASGTGRTDRETALAHPGPRARAREARLADVRLLEASGIRRHCMSAGRGRDLSTSSVPLPRAAHGRSSRRSAGAEPPLASLIHTQEGRF